VLVWLSDFVAGLNIMTGISAEGAKLEIEEHPQFERVWRMLQTIIFGVLMLLVVAALLGLFGSGPAAFARSEDGYARVKFQQFASARSQSRLQVEVPNPASAHISVWIDRDLARTMGIETVKPSPIASVVEASGTRYLFPAGAGGGAIEFSAKPMEPGFSRGTIMVDGRSHSLHQLIWP
jgi:hypothetical protein